MLTDQLLERLKSRLEHRPGLRKILENTGWLLVDRILRLVITLFVGAWVARYLGTEQYGRLSIALAYLVLAMPILKLGLDNVVVQRLVDNRPEAHRILGTASVLRLIGAVLVVPILLLIVRLLHPDDPVILLIVVLLGVAALAQSLEVIEHWFQSQVESKYTVWARNTTFITISALKILAILLHAPLLVFGFLYALDIALYMFALAYVYFSTGGTIRLWKFDLRYAQDLLRTSWPLILGGLAVSVYMRIDQLMLAQMLPDDTAEAEIGVYAAAVRISEMWYFVPAAIVASVFPAVLQSKKQSQSLYYKRMQRLFSLMALISYSVALPITLLSGTIIGVLYGPDFAEAGPILAVLVWAGVWVSLGLARTPLLHAEGLLRFSAISTILGALSNIVLNLILIPAYGTMGCAIATLVAQAIAAQLSTLLYAPTRKFGVIQTRALLFPNPFNTGAA